MKELKETFKDFHEKERQIKQLKVEKKIAQSKINREFRKEYSFVFRTMDVLLVLIILFNVGAMVITNALVVKETPDKNFYEANPIQADVNNFKTTDDAKYWFMGFYVNFVIWALLIGWYVYMRFNIITFNLFYMMAGVIIFYLVGTGLDFFHDFGFWIGTILYGG